MFLPYLDFFFENWSSDPWQTDANVRPSLPLIPVRTITATLEPTLPSHIGFEAAGKIDAVGPRVTGVAVNRDRLVLSFAGGGMLGMQIEILSTRTVGEIDAAFAVIARDRPDALFVAPDGFLNSRGVQFATLAARERIPTTFAVPEPVGAGGLMSYGTDIVEVSRQVGVYTAAILKGAKAAELPVLQSTKFELVINLQTARTLGIEVPSGLIVIADQVIE